ncbi:MAG: AmmeMemoRadiSam system protein B [Acidobacteria bacterium]|nr:AmmeMemoRadiSam system protein B [Acidobacteriota bacterium]
MRLASLVTAAALTAALTAPAQVHTTPMSGRWFAADAEGLNKQVAQAHTLATARQGNLTPRPHLAGLIVPHAGLDYSGAVAAEAWQLAAAHPRNRTIILLAFSHKGGPRGVVSPKVSAYKTPLGTIPVNTRVAAELGFPQVAESELCDHSLENQLPFLHGIVGQAGFVPLYVGPLTPSELNAAAKKLALRAAQGDLIVASSDFTHHGPGYGYQPFSQNDTLPEQLRDRALEAFEHIGSLDVPLFDRFLAETGDTICGVHPIRLLMASLHAARLPHGRVYMTTLDYVNSGQLTRDWTLAVSYGALAFHPAQSFAVAEPDRNSLLAHARAALDSGKPSAAPSPAHLNQRTGVFVTLKKKGELRGCIGTLSPRTALPATIADRTLAAAKSDPRFPPYTPGEGPVTLELSLLTPLRRLPNWRAWQPGMGAVLMVKDTNGQQQGGLLLPQIATENGWGRDEFLKNLSLKAGVPPDSFKRRDARLYVFEAQVFAEPESAANGASPAADAPSPAANAPSPAAKAPSPAAARAGH